MNSSKIDRQKSYRYKKKRFSTIRHSGRQLHSGRVHSNCASPPLREKLMYEHYTLDGCPPNRKSGAPPLNADMVSVAKVENHDSQKICHFNATTNTATIYALAQDRKTILHQLRTSSGRVHRNLQRSYYASPPLREKLKHQQRTKQNKSYTAASRYECNIIAMVV